MTRLDDQVAGLIRPIQDWPSPGITFWDITPLLADPRGLAATVATLTDAAAAFGPIDVVAGVEARGFLIAPAVALALGVGFVPVRKSGKLPAETASRSYALEYDHATIEVHRDSLGDGSRVLIVDDVLATGGTLEAAADLVRDVGGSVAGHLVLIDLPALGGRERLADPIVSLISR